MEANVKEFVQKLSELIDLAEATDEIKEFDRLMVKLWRMVHKVYVACLHSPSVYNDVSIEDLDKMIALLQSLENKLKVRPDSLKMSKEKKEYYDMVIACIKMNRLLIRRRKRRIQKLPTMPIDDPRTIGQEPAEPEPAPNPIGR